MFVCVFCAWQALDGVRSTVAQALRAVEEAKEGAPDIPPVVHVRPVGRIDAAFPLPLDVATIYPVHNTRDGLDIPAVVHIRPVDRIDAAFPLLLDVATFYLVHKKIYQLNYREKKFSDPATILSGIYYVKLCSARCMNCSCGKIGSSYRGKMNVHLLLQFCIALSVLPLLLLLSV